MDQLDIGQSTSLVFCLGTHISSSSLFVVGDTSSRRGEGEPGEVLVSVNRLLLWHVFAGLNDKGFFQNLTRTIFSSRSDAGLSPVPEGCEATAFWGELNSEKNGLTSPGISHVSLQQHGDPNSLRVLDVFGPQGMPRPDQGAGHNPLTGFIESTHIVGFVTSDLPHFLSGHRYPEGDGTPYMVIAICKTHQPLIFLVLPLTVKAEGEVDRFFAEPDFFLETPFMERCNRRYFPVFVDPPKGNILRILNIYSASIAGSMVPWGVVEFGSRGTPHYHGITRSGDDLIFVQAFSPHDGVPECLAFRKAISDRGPFRTATLLEQDPDKVSSYCQTKSEEIRLGAPQKEHFFWAWPRPSSETPEDIYASLVTVFISPD
jgi:hypothetical protein